MERHENVTQRVMDRKTRPQQHRQVLTRSQQIQCRMTQVKKRTHSLTENVVPTAGKMKVARTSHTFGTSPLPGNKCVSERRVHVNFDEAPSASHRASQEAPTDARRPRHPTGAVQYQESWNHSCATD